VSFWRSSKIGDAFLAESSPKRNQHIDVVVLASVYRTSSNTQP